MIYFVAVPYEMASHNFEEGARMIKRILGCMALCGLWMAAVGSLQAHHSLAGVYDMKVDKEMSGTVTTVKFTNPHGSLAIAVKNADGTTTEWVMTLGSATALAQRGIAGKTWSQCSPTPGTRLQ